MCPAFVLCVRLDNKRDCGYFCLTMMNLPGVEPQKRDDLGRPSDYKPEFAAIARMLFARGATDVEVAEELGVDPRTLYRWRHVHSEFLEACRIGKEHADERVKTSFFKLATGYTYTEQQAVKVKDGPNSEKVVVVEVLREQPPNPAAAAKWLASRTKEFRERQTIEHEGAIATSFNPDQLKGLTDEQLAAYTAFLSTLEKPADDAETRND